MPIDLLLGVGGLAAWAALSQKAARQADTLDDIEGDLVVNFSVGVQRLAQAIARAEGFGKVGAIPTVAHNPGDLALGDVGYGTLGAEKITIFPSDTDGWNALYKQLALIEAGQSHVYTRSMSIALMGAHYAPGQPEWSANVAGILGVDETTSLSELFA